MGVNNARLMRGGKRCCSHRPSARKKIMTNGAMAAAIAYLMLSMT